MPSQANSSASSENPGAGPGDAGPAPSAPVDPAPDGEKANPAVEAFNRISQDAAELKEYASYYVAAKIDGFRRTLRNLGLYAALGVLGLIAGGAVLATAAGLIVIGIAEAFTSLFGGRAWLGDIVAGIVVLSAIATVVWVMMNKLTGSWRAQTMKKYQERKQSQRERFGHDVGQRAGKARLMEPKKQSEADFIAEQQEHARAAISQTIVDMKQAVVQSVDVAEWTRQHPWILMGAAAAVGVVAGRLVTPSKEEKLTEFFEEKWEKIKDKFTPAPPAEAAARSVADAPAEKPSFVGSVLKETMKTVGPMLLGLITSYMEQQHNKDEANNGHHGNGKHTEDEPVEGPLKDC